MSIELNRFMTAAEHRKVESVLAEASKRNKINANGPDKTNCNCCGLDEYMDWDEIGQVNAVLQKAVERIPEPRKGGVGEHYLLRLCRCSQYLGTEAKRWNPEIKCSNYLGNGYCSGRRYNYEDDLPFS